jgi:hypothetical protein
LASGERGDTASEGVADAVKVLVELLRRKGFIVECKDGVRGASGTIWRVDCVFSKNYSVFTLNGIILSSHAPPTISLVEHAYTIKNDTGSDKMVVVVPEPGDKPIKSLAKKLGVVILTPHQIRETRVVEEERELGPLETFHLNPVVKGVEVVEQAEKGAGLHSLLGSIFQGRRHKVLGARVAYIPLLCLHGFVHTLDKEPESLEAEESSLCFDMVSGSLVSMDEGSITIVEEWSKLGELSEDAIEVLNRVGSMGTCSLSSLEEALKNEDLELIIELLQDYSLLDNVGGDNYRVAKPPLDNYVSPVEAVRGKGLELLKGAPSCGSSFPALVGSEKIERIVEIHGFFRDKAIIYYPVYVVVTLKEKTGKRIETAMMFDGVSGRRIEDFEEVIAETPAIIEVDKIINDVVERGGVEECG